MNLFIKFGSNLFLILSMLNPSDKQFIASSNAPFLYLSLALLRIPSL
jgi:hypothetical protein